MSITLTRKYNRSMKDVYDRFIMPKAKLALFDLAQKVSIYCKRNHAWLNRTGALEGSIGFLEPEYKGDRWIGYVYAGGWSKARYATQLLKTGHYRIRRRQRGEQFGVRRGAGVYVKYAQFVENKGYPVLLQGIEHYRARATKMLGENLKLRLPGK